MAIERVIGTALVVMGLAWAPDASAADRRDTRRHERDESVASFRGGGHSDRRGYSRTTRYYRRPYGRSHHRAYDPYHRDYRPYRRAYRRPYRDPYRYDAYGYDELYVPYDRGYVPYGYGGYGSGYGYDPYHHPGFYGSYDSGHHGLLGGHIDLRLGGGHHRGGGHHGGGRHH